MLVLSRLIDEAVIITTKNGEIIRITVTKVQQGRVSLGFEADKSIIISREELFKWPESHEEEQ